MRGNRPAAGVLGDLVPFRGVDWQEVPDSPGVYVIYDQDEVIYVGMAGRDGQGSLRRRLRDHGSGQIVNMFAQYLFLARAQFSGENRITHPHDAKLACRSYVRENCSFRYGIASDAGEARSLEAALKSELHPTFNP